jgi:ectoine hydroxylase-related dioxygenase (phytanoyl-CoA dioxygenase family)
MVERKMSMKRELKRIPWGSDVAEVGEIVARDGAVILTSALTPAQVAAVNADLDAPFAALSQGNKALSLSMDADEQAKFISEFMGRKTKRLANSLMYSKVWREDYLASPVLQSYIKAVVPGSGGSYSYSSSECLESHPGQTAQLLHRDGEYYLKALNKNGPGGPEMFALTLLALTDSVEETGATRVIPGSHLWEDYSAPGTPEQTCVAELKAGDLIFYTGRTLHGGGANVTKDKVRRMMTGGFVPGIICGQEAWPFIASWEEVRGYPKVVQEAMGFRSVSFSGETPGYLWRIGDRPVEEVLEERVMARAKPAEA